MSKNEMTIEDTNFLKNHLEKILKKEKSHKFVREIAFVGLGVLAVFWMSSIYSKTMGVLKPENFLELAHMKVSQQIPALNAELKSMAPDLVSTLFDRVVMSLPDIITQQLVDLAKPLIDESVASIRNDISGAIRGISTADIKEMSDPQQVQATYAKAFDAVAVELDGYLASFYKESSPVLQKLATDINTLKNETNLSRKEELIKKILGLVLGVMDRNRVAVN